MTYGEHAEEITQQVEKQAEQGGTRMLAGLVKVKKGHNHHLTSLMTLRR